MTTPTPADDLLRAAEYVVALSDEWAVSGSSKVADDLYALAARLRALAADGEPVAWRPRWAIPKRGPFNEGLPDQDSIDYYNREAHGIEYAYLHPTRQTMTEDESRKAFEAFCNEARAETGGRIYTDWTKGPDGMYQRPRVQDAWNAWKAALAWRAEGEKGR